MTYITYEHFYCAVYISRVLFPHEESIMVTRLVAKVMPCFEPFASVLSLISARLRLYIRFYSDSPLIRRWMQSCRFSKV